MNSRQIGKILNSDGCLRNAFLNTFKQKWSHICYLKVKWVWSSIFVNFQSKNLKGSLYVFVSVTKIKHGCFQSAYFSYTKHECIRPKYHLSLKTLLTRHRFRKHWSFYFEYFIYYRLRKFLFDDKICKLCFNTKRTISIIIPMKLNVHVDVSFFWGTVNYKLRNKTRGVCTTVLHFN